MRAASAASLMLALAACGTTGDAAGPSQTPPSGAVYRTLEVAASRVECVGVGPQTCLQVREAPEEGWTRLHDEIAGFEHEPGYAYQIVVKEEAVANPPADASSIRRTLVTVLSKTRVADAVVGPTWRLVAMEGRPVLPGTRVTAEFTTDDRVAGSAGCNRYFGRAGVKGGGQLSVGLLGSTRMYCGADGVMDQEQAYFAALQNATTYQLANGELRLGPGGGASTLVFRAD
jgi:heat shock protein HslJ